jgi:mannose-1-phosphate guanylyltransferase/mannose-6-phosphate isomerase
MPEATIIMAGGSGTRLWPASLRSHPKQLLRIGSRYSLIQHAMLRAAAASDGPIVIVTNKEHVEPIAKHAAELAQASLPGLQERLIYLPEPMGKNTAPAIALGMAYLQRVLSNDATALILTADHLIEPVDAFVSDARRAATLAHAGHLVCFGIPPHRPETGYGYIEAGAPLDGGRAIAAFKEKPDAQTAAAYLAAGNYFWNAGMFAFGLDSFWAELATAAPEVGAQFTGLEAELELVSRSDGTAACDAGRLRAAYEAVPKISIDYALMERSSKGAVVPASFRWSDVGSWDEAAGIREDAMAAGGRNVGAEPIVIEASGVHVHSELPVAVCGVSDIHVVVQNGKVLVCKRGESQLVKEVVEAAERRDDPRYLS